MTPAEQALLASYAQVAFFNSVNLIVTITGYGAFVLGTCIAMRYLVSHSKEWGRAQTILTTCLIIIFVCFTWDAFYSGGFNLMDVEYTFTKGLGNGTSIPALGKASDKKTLPWQYMPSWAATINLLLSDCIVAWRAWILFQNDRLWKLALGFLMIANIAINIADCIWDDVEVTTEETSSTILDWLSAAISLVVNIFATLLIACKAWHHHRMMTEAFVDYKRTRVQNILLLLIESGAVFCAIQSAYTVCILLDIYTRVDLGFSEAMNVVTAMSIVVAACYPVAVIVLIYKDSSSVIDTFHHNQTVVGEESHALSTAVNSR